MAEVHLVGVEGEDLAFGVAAFELDGEDRFLYLALNGLLEADGEQVARKLLGDRARARFLPLEQIVCQRDQDAGDTQAEVLLEICVLGRDDRLPQDGRDLVVADDDAALGRELSDDLAVSSCKARDGVGTVVIERADLREVAGIRKQDPADGAGQRHDGKQGDDASLLRDAQYDARPGAARFFGGHAGISVYAAARSLWRGCGGAGSAEGSAKAWATLTVNDSDLIMNEA
jgi:hypothetical protein